jgi:hypothetical protein
MDNDFPMQMAGERFGLQPLDVRRGLENGSLDGLKLASAIGSLWPSRPNLNPMAPENSEPQYTAMGAVQPEVTFGV